MTGETISRYKIVEKLGEGGMGAVYQAEDTDLGRPVALKFLAAHLLNDDEAKQRFIREAKAAAAITHPNICHVYEVGEAVGKTFLAMAYLEGESLEDRIAKGPLPLKDVLDIGRQVAEGLEAAHEKGIVHRDIKPANIMVDAKGRATILDFGLARLTEASKLTRPDQTVGTAAYMSPEQMQGGEVDHRTDIWALGCVLYEMVAGVRPFPGQYDQALAYEIVNQDPEPLTSVRAGVPMELDFIVGKSLAKKADERYSSAGDLANDLARQRKHLESGRSHVASGMKPEASSVGLGLASPSHGRERAAIVAALLMGLAAAVMTFLYFSRQEVEKPVRKFSLSIGDADDRVGDTRISPNGRYVAYVRARLPKSAIWLQDLEEDTTRQLVDAAYPFQSFGWSSDSTAIVYRADGSSIAKMPVQGGPSQTVAEAKAPGDLAWSPDSDTVLFSGFDAEERRRLYRVPGSGGVPEKLFEPEESLRDLRYRHPQIVPGTSERTLLYTFVDGNERFTVRPQIAVRDLEDGREELLVEGDEPTYASSGHVVYRSAGGVWALPFSARSLKATGEPFPIAEFGSELSVSNDGSLAYLVNKADDHPSGLLVWVDTEGQEIGTIGQPQERIFYPELSPDETRVAVMGFESGTEAIWVHDVDRPIRTRITFAAGSHRRPVWTASGAEVFFGGQEDQVRSIYRRAADGSGETQPVYAAPEGKTTFISDLSEDDRIVIYDVHPASNQEDVDIWYLERQADGTFVDHPFLRQEFGEKAGDLSPDGRWLVYLSNETGQFEVYVQRFPEGGDKVRLSSDGGSQPRWSRAGDRLYFVSGEDLYAAEVRSGQEITVSQPEALFSWPGLGLSRTYPIYDVSADGRRFVVVRPLGTDERTIRVVLNWFEEFRDRE